MGDTTHHVETVGIYVGKDPDGRLTVLLDGVNDDELFFRTQFILDDEGILRARSIGISQDGGESWEVAEATEMITVDPALVAQGLVDEAVKPS